MTHSASEPASAGVQRLRIEVEIAHTLKSTRPGGIASGWAVRRLTPTECERLQGFPDGWTEIPGASDGPRYKGLGNSFAVPVVRWIGHRITAVEASFLLQAAE